MTITVTPVRFNVLFVLKKTVAERSPEGRGKLFLLRFERTYHVQHKLMLKVEQSVRTGAN